MTELEQMVSLHMEPCPACRHWIAVDRWSHLSQPDGEQRVHMVALDCRYCGFVYIGQPHEMWRALAAMTQSRLDTHDTGGTIDHNSQAAT